MIKVTCYLNQNNRYVGLKIEGHANYDDYGKDIICSAVSSIFVGGCNAISDISNFKVLIESGKSELKLIGNEIDEHDLVVIETIVVQLKTIEDSYKKFIKICEVNNDGA